MEAQALTTEHGNPAWWRGRTHTFAGLQSGSRVGWTKESPDAASFDRSPRRGEFEGGNVQARPAPAADRPKPNPWVGAFIYPSHRSPQRQAARTPASTRKIEKGGG